MAHDSSPGTPSGPQDVREQFAETTRQQIEALAETQKHFWDVAGKISQVWLDQAQSEAALISEMFGRLAATRSPTDAAAVTDYFLGLLYPSEGAANLQLYRDAGIAFLNTADNGTTSSLFNSGLSTSTYDTRVRGLVSMLMTLQRFQEQ